MYSPPSGAAEATTSEHLPPGYHHGGLLRMAHHQHPSYFDAKNKSSGPVSDPVEALDLRICKANESVNLFDEKNVLSDPFEALKTSAGPIPGGAQQRREERRHSPYLDVKRNEYTPPFGRGEVGGTYSGDAGYSLTTGHPQNFSSSFTTHRSHPEAASASPYAAQQLHHDPHRRSHSYSPRPQESGRYQTEHDDNRIYLTEEQEIRRRQVQEQQQQQAHVDRDDPRLRMGGIRLLQDEDPRVHEGKHRVQSPQYLAEYLHSPDPRLPHLPSPESTYPAAPGQPGRILTNGGTDSPAPAPISVASAELRHHRLAMQAMQHAMKQQQMQLPSSVKNEPPDSPPNAISDQQQLSSPQLGRCESPDSHLIMQCPPSTNKRSAYPSSLGSNVSHYHQQQQERQQQHERQYPQYGRSESPESSPRSNLSPPSPLSYARFHQQAAAGNSKSPTPQQQPPHPALASSAKSLLHVLRQYHKLDASRAAGLATSSSSGAHQLKKATPAASDLDERLRSIEESSQCHITAKRREGSHLSHSVSLPSPFHKYASDPPRRPSSPPGQAERAILLRKAQLDRSYQHQHHQQQQQHLNARSQFLSAQNLAEPQERLAGRESPSPVSSVPPHYRSEADHASRVEMQRNLAFLHHQQQQQQQQHQQRQRLAAAQANQQHHPSPYALEGAQPDDPCLPSPGSPPAAGATAASSSSSSGAKGKRGRPRKHAPKIPLPPLYVFIRNMLHNKAYNPRIISWVNEPAGVFKVNNTGEFARTWGRMKSNRSEEMNYEKMSRAMRYHYGSEKQGRKGHLAMVKEKRLVYRFGELAINWKIAEVTLTSCDMHDLCKGCLCLWSKE